MSERKLASLRKSVQGLEWRFAKSMPQHPHWYIRREPAIEDVYVALFHATMEHGQWELFYRRRVQYLYLGDGFKYWRMTDDLNVSRILNRANDDAVYPPGG